MLYKNAFLTTVIATLLILPAFGSTTAQPPISSPSIDFMRTLENNVDRVTGNLDTAKAVDLAKSAPQFQSAANAYTVNFSSIHNTWSFDSSGNVVWDTVNVVFSVKDSKGFHANLVLTEDPSLTSVIQVSWQNNTRSFTPTNRTSANWSGYTFAGNSDSTAPVYEAYATWSVPAVSEPYSYACFFSYCSLGIWPGLSSDSDGANGIVQAGTLGEVYCTIGCTSTYSAWYQFYGDDDQATFCNNFPVAASDSMAVDIVNEARDGGSSTIYNIYISNYRTGQGCNVYDRSYSSFSTPYYGQFITERPAGSGGLLRLPKFGSATMSGAMMNYGGSNHYISDPYNNGWYIRSLMTNSGNLNIEVGAVSSGSFTQTWKTSNGT